jgi:MFS family permease
MSEASSENWIRSLFPFVVMCFGGFMALLDIQIVASSLQHIGGGLSAAQDEISWVQTAYLIAEIIVIPLSGWLTRVFSTRWLFTASAAGFTATSMLCGIAWDIRSMILFRALQGALGASMIPIVFTSSLHYFQGPRRVYSAAVVGSIASIAPTLGPIVGGWITDTWNWHWLFYVNLVPGLAITFLTPLLVDIDKPDPRLLKNADYPGITLMAISLGTLEYVLEEGTRWNWFDDRTIKTCAWIAAISGILFVFRSLTFITHDWGADQLLIPQVLRGLPQVFAVAPAVNLGLASLPPERLKYASGLFNMMRNLGGAVGIAVCGAILNARTNFHFVAIASNLTPANGAMARLLDGMVERYGALPGSPEAGHVAALKQLWQLAYREASTLAYADAFRAIMIAFVIATLLVPLLRNVAPSGAGSSATQTAIKTAQPKL